MNPVNESTKLHKKSVLALEDNDKGSDDDKDDGDDDDDDTIGWEDV